MTDVRVQKTVEGPRRYSGSIKDAQISFVQILKYSTVLLIIVYVAVLINYTSGSTKPFAQIAEALEQRIDTEILVKQDGQSLKRYFGLNSADYAGTVYYTAESNVSAQEVLLIEVKSDAQVHKVRDAIEERVESRKGDFEGYIPEQAGLLEQAKLIVRGKFLFFAVSPEAEEYSALFLKSL